MAETLTSFRARIEVIGEEEHERLKHNFHLNQPLDWQKCSTGLCNLLSKLLHDDDEGDQG